MSPSLRGARQVIELVLVLTLSLNLAFLAGNGSPVHAAMATSQNGMQRASGIRAPSVTCQQSCFISSWSAFGPRQTTVTFKVYGDTTSMLADFDAGLVDITDVPDLAPRINCSSNPGCDQLNPNFFVTNPVAQLGEEQIDISHQVPFLGLSMTCDRYNLPAAGNSTFCSPGFLPRSPTITLVADSTTACDVNHFQLLIHLRNFEENLAPINDPNELITATPVAGTASSASSTTATYDLGCVSAIPPGYTVSTAVYGDGGTVTPGTAHPAKVSIATSSGGTGVICVNNRTCEVNFNVDYKSASTKEPSTASMHIGRALQHLVDKPNFLNLPVLQGQAVCDDVWGSPSQGLMNSVGDPSTACSASNGRVPSVEVSTATIAAECAQDLSAVPGRPIGFTPITPCAPISLYNLVPAKIGAAGGPGYCGVTNSLGVPVPTSTCFPSFGDQGTPIILPEIGYASSQDLIAGCDQLLEAGFTVSSGATCADVVTGNAVGGVTAHLDNKGIQLSFVIRLPGAFPARTRYGTISADELQFLFGTGPPGGGTVCYGFLSPAPQRGATCLTSNPPPFFGIGQVGAPIFQAGPTWNLYTGAQNHGSAPDALLYSLHSQFASSALSGFTCGASLADFPVDYDLFCDPVIDTQSFAGEFSSSFSSSISFFQNTASLAATRGALFPIFSSVDRYAALDSWDNFGLRSSLVSGFGTGFAAGGSGAYYSLLNMRPNGVPPNNPAYAAGGGTPGLIRRSSTSGGTLHENPFTSNFASEADLINGIFDTMLSVNPETSGSDLQLIDWMTKSHSTSFDPKTGLNTQIWNLRNDICWQDSVVGPPGFPCDHPVNADDVCFSLLMQRDGPGVKSIAVQDIVSCSFPDPQTVVIVHSALSAFQDINAGSVHIVPAHLWGTACGWATGPHDSSHEPNVPYNSATGLGTFGAPCVQSGFDPMALTSNGSPFSTPLPPGVSGLMVGSGPLMCLVPSHVGPGPTPGMVGGPCTTDPSTQLLKGQALDIGYEQIETRFALYMRCCDTVQGSNLEALSWADSAKIGKVTIVAAAALSFVFGKKDSYFGDPLYGQLGTVGIGQAAMLASKFDSGIVSPCLSLQCPGPPNEPTPASFLFGADQNIDPYLATLSSGAKVYYLATTHSSSSGGLTGTVELEVFSGTVVPSSFTATIGAQSVTGSADPVVPGDIVFKLTNLSSTRSTVVITNTSAFPNPPVVFTITT